MPPSVTCRACADLVMFLDGELDEVATARFRAHLPGCDPCLNAVVVGAQLSARLSALRGQIIE